ncbi:XRE family transcriptional regulator [Streptomyces rimosus]|uniref:XRE family transcriptional regulator n=1 Tax=Streptomyces rimosus TaxID=1927 RepID=UPI0031DCFDDB
MEGRSTPHGPSCAKQKRALAAQQAWTPQQAAFAIHECCGVTKLRAHRLARGLTLRQAADRLQKRARTIGPGTPRPDAEQLRLWELGNHKPRTNAVALLCWLYECEPGDLELAPQQEVPLPVNPQVAPLAIPRPAELTPDRRAALFLDGIERARRQVDRSLAASSVSTSQLDMLDDRLLWVRQQYVFTPPVPMLQVLVQHLNEVKELAVDRQPAMVQARLSAMTALLSTLVADALMKLGNLSHARAWYDTARNAADDSGDVELRARVRAQAAMLPYYYGPLTAAIRLAHEAKLICRGRPTATGSFAAAAEARARAQQGDQYGAQAAIRYAQDMFAQCTPGADTDAFAFPERRFLLYLSGAYTALGHTMQARRVQSQGLALYPARTGIDPSLLHLEAAICLARDRSPTEACDLAGATYLKVPSAHRTRIVEQRARQVIGVLPPAIRRGPAVRQLQEILALPPGQG